LGALLLLFFPAQALAKGQTIKITIEGAGLRAPIEITDPHMLVYSNVWSDPGTSSTGAGPNFNHNAPSFIIDWSQGAMKRRPDGQPLYKISFWAKEPNERLVYVVSLPV
jgi:hypothetical protein